MANDQLNISEVWKAIPDFSGYEISDRGRIRSYWGIESGLMGKGNNMRLQKTPQKILRQSIDGDGYMRINFRKERKKIRQGVHRLVLLSFVGPCPPGHQCRHLNGNRSDNYLSNLCWGTPCENQSDRKEHGREHISTCPRGENQWQAKLTSENIIEIRKMRFQGYSLKSIAEKFGIAQSNVSLISNRKTWTHI